MINLRRCFPRLWQHRPSLSFRIALFLAASLLLPAALTPRASAKEQLREFVEGLRQRQLHDVALDYLAAMQESSLVDDETKQVIPYEQGRTLVDMARVLRDFQQRSQRLDEATRHFEQFVNGYPDHPLAGAANIELGNVEVERGRAKLELASRPSRAKEKDQLRAEALEHFEKAKDVFAYAEQKYEAELAGFPKLIDPNDREQLAARQQARLNLIEAQMLSAMILFEMAEAHEPDSNDRKQLLSDASKDFQSLYEQYRLKVAGLTARLYQARCLQELGDLVMALTYYEELLVQDKNVPVLRDLAAKALRQAIQCWLDDSQKKYDRAIEEGENWIRDAAPHELTSPVGLAIRWQTAQAYEKRAATQEEEAAKNRDLLAAIRHAEAVARTDGDHQRQARGMIARLRNVEGDQQPTTFAEARDAAKAALDRLQVISNQIRLARTTGQGKEKLDSLAKEEAAARQEAIDTFRLAIQLRDAETNLEEVNQIRYFQCYLFYQDGRFYDAAVLGEFLARNYPDSAAARPGAEIAVAAYLKAYNQSDVAEREFETGQLVSLAHYLAQQWPDQPQAQEAWLILGDLAVRSGDMQQAAEYFANIPEDSPRRTVADLKHGRALWARYLRTSQQEGDQRPDEAALEELTSEAERLLVRGTKTFREQQRDQSTPSADLISAELTLAQLYLETGRPEQAVQLLERPDNGLLAIVRGARTTDDSQLPLETYKTALRAYVMTQQLDKAQQTMQALDDVAKSAGGDAASLTRVYVSLGRQLQEQVDRLREQKKEEQLAAVLESFEMFLERIASREQGNTFSTLRWVADTYAGLAEGAGSGAQSQRAKDLFAAAVSVYDTILKRAQTQPGFAPQGAGDAIKIAKAKALRGRGQYKDALLLIVEVLEDNPKTLQAQIEAADTYQAWAAENPSLYTRAISGRRVKRGGKEVEIWGWARLATLVERYPKFRATYHLARYRVAECRYELALTQSKPEQIESLERAQRDIKVTARLDPEMGGDEWFARYDALLKKIQRSLGEKSDGLSAVLGASRSAGVEARRR